MNTLTGLLHRPESSGCGYMQGHGKPTVDSTVDSANKLLIVSHGTAVNEKQQTASFIV
jgi:hypothetical protein